MNVLSLFDGISCGRLALNKAGIKYDKYYASEIDQFAIKVAQHNFPDTIQLGDVEALCADMRGDNILPYNLPNIDLLIGGSPCQGFSRGGNRLMFKDDRSKLIFTYIEILKELAP